MNRRAHVSFPTGNPSPCRRPLTASYVWALLGAAALIAAFWAAPAHAQTDADLAAYARALTRAQAGDHPGALAAYEELIAATSGAALADVQAAMALSYRASGDLPAARRAAEQALALRPAARYATLAGALALEAGAFSDAQAAFERALNADGQHAPAIAGLADVHARLGRYADAAQTLARLPRPTPAERLRTFELAERGGDLDLAAQTIEALVAVRPYDPDLHAAHARLLVRQGATDAAAAAFARTLALDPSNAEARAFVGAASAQTPSAARAEAPALIPATPARSAWWSGSGTAQALQAEADANPRDADAWGVAAMAWLETGDDARAAQTLSDGLLFFPGDTRLHLAAAFLTALTGADPEPALEQAAQDADPAEQAAVEAARSLAAGQPADVPAELSRSFLVPAPESRLFGRLVGR
jgi:tetratricopeptide (TPR) repeat protein